MERALTRPSAGERLAVRRARPADIECLLTIEEIFPTDRLDRRGFRHAIRSPTIDCLVLVADGEPVGYAMVHRRANSRLARLTSIAMSRKAAGRGLGRRLLEASEGAARRKGCRCLRLEVRADNRPAQKLYESSGYQRFETVEDYYEDGEAALRYEKPLR